MPSNGSSRVFAPHRAIGVVGDGRTPFSLQSLGGEPFVTVSVGHAFQVFNGEHLRVVAVSQRMPRAITALATRGDRTFVACGKVLLLKLRCIGRVLTLWHPVVYFHVLHRPWMFGSV